MHSQPPSKELLPCPRCRSPECGFVFNHPALGPSWLWIKCEECGLRSNDRQFHHGEHEEAMDEARAWWNERTGVEPQPVASTESLEHWAERATTDQIVHRLRTWPMGEIGKQAADVIERLQRDLLAALEQRNAEVRLRQAAERASSEPRLSPLEMTTLQREYQSLANDHIELCKRLKEAQEGIEAREREIRQLRAAQPPGALRPGLERAIEIVSATETPSEYYDAYRTCLVDALDAAIGSSETKCESQS
jgi:hypothetical protein